MAPHPRVTVAGPSISTNHVSSRLADHLRRQIISGQLRAGDALPAEAELTAEWAVSRSTLREAFRVLENESLITVHRGSRGGARVTAPQPQVAAKHVGHLLQYRGATIADISSAVIFIQPRAVHLLATARPADALDALDACLATEERLLDDPVAFSHSSNEFGRLLTDGCGDKMLCAFGEILFHLRSRTAEYIMVQLFGDGLLSRGRKAIQWVHRRQVKVLELIRAGDAEAAERYWSDFLQEQLELMPEVARHFAFDAWSNHSRADGVPAAFDDNAPSRRRTSAGG